MHAASLYTLQIVVAGSVVKVNLRLDGKAQPHAQTVLLTCTVVLHYGHTFVTLFALLASASVSYLASYRKKLKNVFQFRGSRTLRAHSSLSNSELHPLHSANDYVALQASPNHLIAQCWAIYLSPYTSTTTRAGTLCKRVLLYLALLNGGRTQPITSSQT